MAAILVHQEHDPEILRRAVQGHLPGDIRERLQEAVRGCEDLVRAPPHRRHGRASHQERRRLRVGVQELRW